MRCPGSAAAPRRIRDRALDHRSAVRPVVVPHHPARSGPGRRSSSECSRRSRPATRSSPSAGSTGSSRRSSRRRTGGDLVVEIADGIHVRVARKGARDGGQAREDENDEDERRRGRDATQTDAPGTEVPKPRRRAAAPTGVEEVNGEKETVNPGVADTGGAVRTAASLRAAILDDPSRSPHRRRPRRRRDSSASCLMAVPSSPIHKKSTLGLDLQGGLEITKQAVPPKGRKLTKEDLEPVGLDHARPRRPPRRLRAGDPHAGQRPDHDPAAGRQGSRGRGEDHRQDGAARALRPRGEPRAAVDRRAALPGREELGLRAPRRPAGARAEGHVRPVLALQQAEEARRRPGRDEEGRARASTTGKVPEGWKLFAVPPGTVVISVRRSARSSARASRRRTRRRTTTTSSSTRRRPSRR